MEPDRNDIPFDSYILDAFYVFDPGAVAGRVPAFFADALAFIQSLWNTYVVLSLLASIILFVGLIYALMRRSQLTEAMVQTVYDAEKQYQELYKTAQKKGRFDDIVAYLNVEDPNSWKLAIIEADVMLYEVLENHGLTGDSVGEKLKGATRNMLASLDTAWEAHKVRNQIAHSGSDFVLTKKIAQDTIAKYRTVFEELGVA